MREILNIQEEEHSHDRVLKTLQKLEGQYNQRKDLEMEPKNTENQLMRAQKTTLKEQNCQQKILMIQGGKNVQNLLVKAHQQSAT